MSEGRINLRLCCKDMHDAIGGGFVYIGAGFCFRLGHPREGVYIPYCPWCKQELRGHSTGWGEKK